MSLEARIQKLEDRVRVSEGFPDYILSNSNDGSILLNGRRYESADAFVAIHGQFRGLILDYRKKRDKHHE